MNQGDQLVTLGDIRQAARISRGKLHRTPVMSAKGIGIQFRVELFLKMELFQKTGSFKPRGVLNRIHHLTEVEKSKGVISLSAGNHAQALAWGASAVGIPATIVMPSKAVKSKVEATRGYGGQVILTEANLLETCLQIQRERDLTLVHPFDHPDVIAGQGTVGLEIMDDLSDLDVLVVSIGGGGLISGIAAAAKKIKPGIRIIGVEPERSDVMSQSLEAGEPVTLEPGHTAADGLDAPFAGRFTLRHVQEFVDEVITVTEEEMVDGVRLLMERAKIVPEVSAGAPLAALSSGKVELEPNSRVALVICGGNISLDVLKKLI